MDTKLIEQLDRLAALRAAVGKPGPWTWDFRPGAHSISLCNGWDTVLDTKRWGSQGATIRMEDPENPGCLLPIHVDAVPHEGRAHHKDWALTVNPNRAAAAFIAAAGSLDFAALRAALTPPAAPGGAGAAGEAAAALDEAAEYASQSNYQAAYLKARNGLRAVQRAATSAAPAAAPDADGPVGFGVRMLPAEKGPGVKLEGDFLYVLLPDGKITQAMWYEFAELGEWPDCFAWGHYTDVDCIDPLTVQPTHYFTPPVHP